MKFMGAGCLIQEWISLLFQFKLNNFRPDSIRQQIPDKRRQKKEKDKKAGSK